MGSQAEEKCLLLHLHPVLFSPSLTLYGVIPRPEIWGVKSAKMVIGQWRVWDWVCLWLNHSGHIVDTQQHSVCLTCSSIFRLTFVCVLLYLCPLEIANTLKVQLHPQMYSSPAPSEHAVILIFLLPQPQTLLSPTPAFKSLLSRGFLFCFLTIKNSGIVVAK